jgi:hypothetical protein
MQQVLMLLPPAFYPPPLQHVIEQLYQHCYDP